MMLLRNMMLLIIKILYDAIYLIKTNCRSPKYKPQKLSKAIRHQNDAEQTNARWELLKSCSVELNYFPSVLIYVKLVNETKKQDG